MSSTHMTSMEPQENLSTMINPEVTVSRFPRGSNLRFAPRRVLDLITKDSIIQHFHGIPLDKDLIDYILKDAIELLAICIAISMPTDRLMNLMQSLKTSGFTEKRGEWIDKEIAKIFPGRNDGWAYMLTFHRYMFQAPVISQELRHHKRNLPDGMPLPVELCDNQPLAGGFGTVYKITIHEKFLIDTDPINEMRTAAIKEFIQGKDPKVWERETTALEKIGSRNLLHVVDVKAMFIQTFRFYLVFPWADGGNLMDFWKAHKFYHSRCHIARHFIPHILQQLLGLSFALRSLHNFNGNGKVSYRHGDLKPENILVFLSQDEENGFPGTWKMSDLGLAKMHEEITGARHEMQATSMRGFGTTSYKPPEAFDRLEQPTTRLFDIWSMGCIILQLITWLVYGMDGVAQLTRRTTLPGRPSCFWKGDFSSIGGWTNQEVHHEVTALITKLEEDLKNSPPLLQLLAIVKDQLLVIETPPPGSQGGDRYRTNAYGLHESLSNICQTYDQTHPSWSYSWEAVQESLNLAHGKGAIWSAQRGGNYNGTTTLGKTEILTLESADREEHPDVLYIKQELTH